MQAGGLIPPDKILTVAASRKTYGLKSQDLLYAPTGEAVPSVTRLRELLDADPSALVIIRHLGEHRLSDLEVVLRPFLLKDTVVASDAMPLTWHTLRRITKSGRCQQRRLRILARRARTREPSDCWRARPQQGLRGSGSSKPSGGPAFFQHASWRTVSQPWVAKAASGPEQTQTSSYSTPGPSLINPVISTAHGLPPGSNTCS